MTEAEMVETVARTLAGMSWPWESRENEARRILTALGLIGPSPTHWLAPWEASEGMSLAAVEEINRRWPTIPHFQGNFEIGYLFMRDAHLGKARQG